MDRTTKAGLAIAAAGLGTWLLSRTQRPKPLYDFRDKVVLITGGSRGLGLVLARELAAQGACIAICARGRDSLNRADDDIAQHGEPPLALPCDVTDSEQVRDLLRAVEVHLGPVDVLINNAGIIAVGPESEMTREDYEQAMAVHFWGPYNTVEAVLPSMRARKQGRIVNVSSIGGKVSVPHLLPYNASKFALVGYSQGLRAELAKSGIVVTTICPGLMRTGSPRNALFKGQNEAEYAWFKIGDSLPGLTLSAQEAARQIIEACRRGEAEMVLSLPAQLAAKFRELFPEFCADLLALVNRLLPGPGGVGTEARLGKESETRLSLSALTESTQEAAMKNNEVAP